MCASAFMYVFRFFSSLLLFFFFFKQKTAYEMRISDWSSDVCSSDLCFARRGPRRARHCGLHPCGGGVDLSFCQLKARVSLDRRCASGADTIEFRDDGRSPLVASLPGPIETGSSPSENLLLRIDDAQLTLIVKRQEIGRASSRERGCKYVG